MLFRPTIREPDGLGDSAWDALDAAIARLEEGWRRGTPPDIGTVVPADLDSAAKRSVLLHLIGIDLEWRWKTADTTVRFSPGLRDSRRCADRCIRAARGPCLALPPTPCRLCRSISRARRVEHFPLDLLVDEYYARRRYGDRPTHEEYVEEFGSLYPELIRRLKDADDEIASALIPDLSLERAISEDRAGRPDRIGRYSVKQMLGKGTFGTVYRAYDETLNRPVAIKVPHRHMVRSQEDIQQYLNEAQVLASLDHPAIVPVFDAGQTEDGLCYVVSKFVEGGDLTKRIKETPLSHIESARLVMTVAEALHHAHRRMVVHRDVKPGNILIDTAGKCYLADFGVALTEEVWHRSWPCRYARLHESRAGPRRRASGGRSR